MEEIKEIPAPAFGNDEYSILITPPGTGRIYKLQIKPWQLRLGVVVGILFLSVVLIGAAFYGKILIQARTTAGLQAEVELLHTQLAQLEILQIEVQKLERFRKDVLELTGISEPRIQADEEGWEKDSEGIEESSDSRSNRVNRMEMADALRGEDVAGQAQRIYPEQLKLVRSLIFQRPCPGPISRGFSIGASGGEIHSAVDLAGSVGTGIAAAGPGVVIRTEKDDVFGLVVVLGHGGDIQTLYGHNSKILVSQGERVEAGQLIAEMGNTGLSSAPHLHFEIRLKDQPIDPAEIITSLRPERLK
ncbi:MAG: M23 family metallopeptidase [Candidatus Eisenbacteria bacterium]|uniref:M23 family metallopeptidase n=1 Tax=Eiseniibacteriota bacterium TaxID=2212470 RepID=A0A948RYG1_UNCEI|nr:M23 family metallopeptidase [Candidatus Eisenbacteria bacterium]